jgi:hypothetical protein
MYSNVRKPPPSTDMEVHLQESRIPIIRRWGGNGGQRGGTEKKSVPENLTFADCGKRT